MSVPCRLSALRLGQPTDGNTGGTCNGLTAHLGRYAIRQGVSSRRPPAGVLQRVTRPHLLDQRELDDQADEIFEHRADAESGALPTELLDLGERPALAVLHGLAARRRPTGANIGSLGDGQGATADTRTIDDHDRVSQIECGDLCQDSVEQRKHLCVRVRAATEQDDTGTIGLVECNEARIVEIRSDDDSLLAPRHVEHLAVSRSSESEIDGVDRIMTGSSQVWPSVGRHRHVDQELQPVSSMISSSARLAA